jgi:hypothetical protein
MRETRSLPAPRDTARLDHDPPAVDSGRLAASAPRTTSALRRPSRRQSRARRCGAAPSEQVGGEDEQASF